MCPHSEYQKDSEKRVALSSKACNTVAVKTESGCKNRNTLQPVYLETALKITVLGAGAMGSLFSGYLSRKNDVTVVDVSDVKQACMMIVRTAILGPLMLIFLWQHRVRERQLQVQQ